MESLEDLIKRWITLSKPSPSGFFQTKCAVCGDYKERAGFKFDSSHCGMSCFNCGAKFKYENGSGRLSKNARQILLAFGIPEDELTKIVGRDFVERQGTVTASTEKKPIWSPPKSIEPPPGDILSVLSDDSPWCEIARLYLSERSLDPAAYPYMISDAVPGRLIIPYTHRERLIYWQGRALTDTIQPRYYNPPVSDKEKLIFNYDELLDGTSVLYVTEGALDALSIGPAVAMSDSHASDWKLNELRKAASRGRKIVFVVDKNKVGADLGMLALKEGWSVVVLPDGVDDANHGLRRFGKLWLLNHLASTAVDGIAGQVLLRMKCVRDDRKHTKHTHDH